MLGSQVGVPNATVGGTASGWLIPCIEADGEPKEAAQGAAQHVASTGPQTLALPGCATATCVGSKALRKGGGYSEPSVAANAGLGETPA